MGEEEESEEVEVEDGKGWLFKHSIHWLDNGGGG